MDIIVKGRNVDVPDHFRDHIADKLQKVERYDHKIIEVNVELSHERNRRQSANCQRVEITCVSRGPVVRAEACSSDFYSALDLAAAKLDTRLRRGADRRRIHRGRHAPVSVAEATASLVTADEVWSRPSSVAVADRADSADELDNEHLDGGQDDDQPWHIARTKEHPADPMTVDDALFQMELVGHDFYLFHDKDTDRPSVVYRRRAYDYGIISLAR